MCWPQTLPPEFVSKVRELETLLGLDIWLFAPGTSSIDFPLLDKFTSQKDKLPPPQNIDGSQKSRLGLLINSVAVRGNLLTG
jgi:hypothetical protein